VEWKEDWLRPGCQMYRWQGLGLAEIIGNQVVLHGVENQVVLRGVGIIENQVVLRGVEIIGNQVVLR